MYESCKLNSLHAGKVCVLVVCWLFLKITFSNDSFSSTIRVFETRTDILHSDGPKLTLKAQRKNAFEK